MGGVWAVVWARRPRLLRLKLGVFHIRRREFTHGNRGARPPPLRPVVSGPGRAARRGIPAAGGGSEVQHPERDRMLRFHLQTPEGQRGLQSVTQLGGRLCGGLSVYARLGARSAWEGGAVGPRGGVRDAMHRLRSNVPPQSQCDSTTKPM